MAKTIDEFPRIGDHPLKVCVTLVSAVNTMISSAVNYVQHHGFEKNDSIISLKLLTTMSIAINILFKIVKNSLAISL
jgi:hypothetical protein